VHGLVGVNWFNRIVFSYGKFFQIYLTATHTLNSVIGFLQNFLEVYVFTVKQVNVEFLRLLAASVRIHFVYRSYRFAALFIFQSLPPVYAYNCQLIRFMSCVFWSPPSFLLFAN